MIEAMIVVVVLAAIVISAVHAPEIGLIIVIGLVGVATFVGVNSEREHQQKVESAPCREFSDAPTTEVTARCTEYFESVKTQ